MRYKFFPRTPQLFGSTIYLPGDVTQLCLQSNCYFEYTLYQPSTRHLIDSIKYGDRGTDIASVEYIKEDDLYVVYYEVRPSPHFANLMQAYAADDQARYAGYENWTAHNRHCFFLVIPETSKYFNVDSCAVAHNYYNYNVHFKPIQQKIQ